MLRGTDVVDMSSAMARGKDINKNAGVVPGCTIFSGLTPLLRENDAEAEYPLLAKRCAPGATALWPGGEISR
jgi:hypothetical protein